MNNPYEVPAARVLCEDDHLFFTRYFFKSRQAMKFRMNWHHHVICKHIDDVIGGRVQNIVFNVAPGSSKTELVVINLIARGLALNPRARFLHLSYSDDLASLNSSAAREIVTSDDFQRLWPMKIADDSKSKKRWNIMLDGKRVGGVYATSLGGQITGFRAGHMAEGFQGAIVIDDPLKPEDAFSRTKLDSANRVLVSTVKSRRANSKTPIVMIMQRIAENDPTGFIEKGNLGDDWKIVRIPALVDPAIEVPEEFRHFVENNPQDPAGRCSYWEYKEPLKDLLAMESGGGTDQTGNRISRHVFSSQYQQRPTRVGGNIIHGRDFKKYTIAPKITQRFIYADTAQKTKERNDYSVFGCFGMSVDRKLYLIDIIRGKWEAPELKSRAIAFFMKHRDPAAFDLEQWGSLRKMLVEDKVSGTGLIQTIKSEGQFPVEGIERNKDKLTRVMDALPHIQAGFVFVPEAASFTNDFIDECEAFTADDSHDFDDQVDVMCDAVNDMLGPLNKLSTWTKLGGNP